jgi:hypothetical protein
MRVYHHRRRCHVCHDADGREWTSSVTRRWPLAIQTCALLGIMDPVAVC